MSTLADAAKMSTSAQTQRPSRSCQPTEKLKQLNFEKAAQAARACPPVPAPKVSKAAAVVGSFVSKTINVAKKAVKPKPKAKSAVAC